MRGILRFLILTFLTSLSTQSKSLLCFYQKPYETFDLDDVQIYWCKVNATSNFTLNQPQTQITEITGIHGKDRTNNDVNGIFFNNSVVNYFPKNIERFYSNLLVFEIRNCGLMEISREDLMVFPDLRYLSLGINNLRFLERDLFKYNQNLEYLWLFKNKITFVDSKIFDNLKNLKSLNFNQNPGFPKNFMVRKNSLASQKLINKVVEKCFDLDIDFRVKNLVSELNSTNSNLKNHLHENDATIKGLNGTIVNFLAEKKEMDEKFMEIKEENENLRRNLSENLVNMKTLENHKLDLEKDSSNLKNYSTSLNISLFTAKTEIDQLKALNNELTLNQTKLNDEKFEIQEELKNSRSSHLKIIANKNQEVEMKNSMISNYTNEITNLNAKIFNLDLLVLDYEKQNLTNERKIRELNENAEKLRKKIVDLTEEIETKKANISETSSLLRNCKKDNQNLSHNLKNALNDIEKCQNNVKLLKISEISLKNTVIDKNQEISKLNTKIQENLQKISLLDEKVQTLISNLTELQEEFNELSENNTETLEELSSLKDEYTNLQINLTETSSYLQNCAEESEKSTKEFSSQIEELITQISELNSQITTLTHKNHKDLKIMDELRSEINEKSTNIESGNLRLYIALGVMGILVILNISTLIAIYCKKRGYNVYKPNLLTKKSYNHMSVDTLHNAMANNGYGFNFDNPTFDDIYGGIEEMDSSLEGLGEIISKY